MNSLGLYIHIPFCKSKCRYCDFCSFPNPKEDSVSAYLDALCEEIGSYGTSVATHAETVRRATGVPTVYFGGGTPSLMTIDQLARILEALRCRFPIEKTAEITLECNPATVDLAYLTDLRRLGVNRLSIGAQSFRENELRRLGRLHTPDDVRKTVSDARAAGFDNVSIDLMLGIPEQTEESLAETLKDALALSPEHLSVYGLQIEEGTYFYRHRDELPFPDEDTECRMYQTAAKTLADAGILKYEVSNFAKPGRESRHNLRYWRREDYLGLGLAAHSSLGNRRFANTEELPLYLAGKRLTDMDLISPHNILAEKIMLGMRLTAGVDFAELCRDHGKEARIYRDIFAEYAAPGFVRVDGDRLSFTDEGMYVSNTILAHVLNFEE